MTPNASTALITGGTSGIGRAAAKKLAQLGIHVIVVGRHAERGEQTVADIRAAGGTADFLASDLRDASSAREVARRAVEVGNGHIDMLINNAGIYPFGPTHDTTEEVFDSVYALNVKVPYFLVAALAPLMAQRGTGAIVNLSTMVAEYGAPGMSLYGSSKAALNLLTKTWAAEYGPSGVRVNAVSPGPDAHGRHGRHGGGARAIGRPGASGPSSDRGRDCGGHCLFGDGAGQFYSRRHTRRRWRAHGRVRMAGADIATARASTQARHAMPGCISCGLSASV
jgi:NAD(P)-dependent dehydrogenase (short-subunit alcohol dehydrogenase family)